MTLAPGRTYRYFTGTPLYPFGWGLSYTTFSLSWTPEFSRVQSVQHGNDHTKNAKTTSIPAPIVVNNTAPSTTVLSVQVTNTGSTAGDEVVLVFFSTDAVPSSDPASVLIRQLFAFERVTLSPMETATLSFTVDPLSSFMLYDADGNEVSYPGNYTLIITNGVDMTLTQSMVVMGEYRVLDTFV